MEADDLISSYQGGRDSERVNGLVRIGYKHLMEQPDSEDPIINVELIQDENVKFLVCSWSVDEFETRFYEFYGNGEVYVAEEVDEETVHKFDVSSVVGGLDLAIIVLEDIFDLPESERPKLVAKISQSL